MSRLSRIHSALLPRLLHRPSTLHLVHEETEEHLTFGEANDCSASNLKMETTYRVSQGKMNAMLGEQL